MITFRFGRPGLHVFHQKRLFFLFWLFLLVLPKGGFKAAGIPITWGYVLIGIVSLFLFFKSIQECSEARVQAYLATCPFQIIAAATIFFNGTDNLGHTISFFISFVYLPFFFLLLISKFMDNLDLERFFKFLKLGIFIIAVYGIFLFIFKTTTGKFIEIPFLTTNFHDLGELENKHIQRGYLFKLISTYNNGNIFGVCILMLLPLYCYLEKSSWKQWLVKGAIILTLARTAWLGLVFSEILYLFVIEKKTKTFASYALLKFSILILSVYFIQLICGFDLAFLFDGNLGGRKSQISMLNNASLISFIPFDGIAEIVYLSILTQFGMIGFVFFLLAMIAPLLLALSSSSKLDRSIHYTILAGLLNYLFVCASDGAMLYIPTMAFYWFLCSLALRKKMG